MHINELNNPEEMVKFVETYKKIINSRTEKIQQIYNK